jgi:hypothetical protein
MSKQIPQVGDIWQERISDQYYKYLLLEEIEGEPNTFLAYDLEYGFWYRKLYINLRNIDWKKLA